MFSCNLPLHFWQNDQDLLRATAVTRGQNRYRNKSQNRKLTLEKKILPLLLQGLKPVTMLSWVLHWAIPAHDTKHIISITMTADSFNMMTSLWHTLHYLYHHCLTHCVTECIIYIAMIMTTDSFNTLQYRVHYLHHHIMTTDRMHISSSPWSWPLTHLTRCSTECIISIAMIMTTDSFNTVLQSALSPWSWPVTLFTLCYRAHYLHRHDHDQWLI